MRLDEEAAPATVPATAPAHGSAGKLQGKRAVRSTRPPELEPVLSADYHPSPGLEGGDLLALRAGGAELFFGLLPVALGYSLPPPSVAPLAARLTAVLRSLGERCIARRPARYHPHISPISPYISLYLPISRAEPRCRGGCCSRCSARAPRRRPRIAPATRTLTPNPNPNPKPEPEP